MHLYITTLHQTTFQVKHSEYMAVNAATAHAHYDPDGTVYNMGSSFKGHPYYNIIVIPPADKTNNGRKHADNAVLCKYVYVIIIVIFIEIFR